MLTIIDKTLSCMDDYSCSKEELLSFITLLKACDVNQIELSQKMYAALEGHWEDTFILRIDHPRQMIDYPEIRQFVCANGGSFGKKLYQDCHINDPHDSRLAMQNKDVPTRITGLGGLFQGDVDDQCKYLAKILPKKVEFCPTDECHCATGAAVAWVHYGLGSTLVTTVGGIGGYAPFEEVLISLRHLFRRKPSATYKALPQLRGMISQKTGQRWDRCAPVVGEDVFAVESGIHIGGILRHPKCYEPFPPESVGLTRKFIYGKFSGHQGIAQKLEEMGYHLDRAIIDTITHAVKTHGQTKERSITEKEFRVIVEHYVSCPSS